MYYIFVNDYALHAKMPFCVNVGHIKLTLYNIWPYLYYVQTASKFIAVTLKS